jgi:hypothetical protein
MTLGAEFVANVRRALTLITEHGASGAPMRAGRRRVLVPYFPFAIVYRELPATGSA